jgi:predicted esterase
MPWDNFEDLEAHGEHLYFEHRLDEFIELYKSELENFPENLPEMIRDLAFVYLANGDKENAIAFLSAGLERGYFFPFTPEGAFVRELGNDPHFKPLLAYNQKLQEIAQQSAQPQWIVVLPDGYDTLQTYPLFLTLHGYGENIATMQRFWHAPLLKEKCIHAYLQSSQVVDLKNFGWEDSQLARQEVLQMSSEITDQYPVRLDRMMIGGFSQGATLSIDLAITQALPLCGFIALCPQKPDSVTQASLQKANEIGLKSVILTGEKDPALPEQRDMLLGFQRANFPHRMHIAPGLGHWFPDDLPRLLNQSLQFLMEEA